MTLALSIVLALILAVCLALTVGLALLVALIISLAKEYRAMPEARRPVQAGRFTSPSN